MAREKKFNFIPEFQFKDGRAKEDLEITATINKTKTLMFSKGAVEELGLENKVVKLYADPQKKVIGWSEIEGGYLGVHNLSHNHRLTKNKSGHIVVGVAKLLVAIGIKEISKSYKKLKIQKWYDQMEKKTYYYVVIRKQSD